MPSIAVLEDVELIPVLQFEPFRFAAADRLPPCRRYEDIPEEWHRYWLESLADSGITGLTPIEEGSWHVPTREFAEPTFLGRVLEPILKNRLETDATSEPDCMPLNGGLALRCQSQNVLIEPGCCADLGHVASWRDVVGYRQAEWRAVWIGHPWVSARYDAPRLVISSPHEAEEPVASLAVCPDRLQAALVAAVIELERFAQRIADALPSGYEADHRLMGRRLAGLSP